MSRSCQPSFVADRESVIHIEDRFLGGTAQTSITRCGRELSFDGIESRARFFHLSYRHLFETPCRECRDA